MDYNDIEMSDLSGEQLDLAECIGIEAYRRLSSMYSGNYIYIAKCDSVLTEKRNKKIRSEYTGGNIRELSIKYRLAEVTIRQIVAPERTRIMNEPTSGQMHL